MRADARRNYERLLAEARDLFEEQGPDAPLEEIARRADVGVGTLYRHFPTRQAVQEAVYRGRMQEIADAAYRLAKEYEPGEALLRWLRVTLDHSANKKGLATALTETIGRDSELFASCREMITKAGELVLSNAQKAGIVRADVDAMDLLKLVHGIAVATETTPDRADVLLGYIFDGIRG
ncbi:TetR/AcrR family transcriptional regulator [Streptosporangiaceae bacterium NEAU-GS5]|nr:TetR/AcrR family transcriptional regulator [Streptosporangiaceae bacterium NEAU-GS5]